MNPNPKRNEAATHQDVIFNREKNSLLLNYHKLMSQKKAKTIPQLVILRVFQIDLICMIRRVFRKNLDLKAIKRRASASSNCDI